MKIVYLHQYYSTPEESGGARSYEMARRFAAAGHDVHVVTSRAGENRLPRWSTHEREGVTVHAVALDYDNSMSYARRILAFVGFALLASWRARGLRGDVVFATSTPLTIAIPGVMAKRGAPMVFEVRDVWPELPIALGALRNPVLKWLARRLELFAYDHADAVIALSTGMAERVAARGYPPSQITVVPNACDNAFFDVEDTIGKEFRRDREWLGGRPLAVYAGTLGLVNGVGYLAHLAHATRRLDPEIRFLIVGAGAEWDSVARTAENLRVLNVNFFMEEPVPKNAMPQLLNAATTAISVTIPLPELEPNSANKFFDALAAGRPICTNYGGWQAELIAAHRLGVVLDEADFDAAALFLVEFLHDPNRIREAGLAARAVAETEFDRDALSARALSVLEGIARAPHTEREGSSWS